MSLPLPPFDLPVTTEDRLLAATITGAKTDKEVTRSAQYIRQYVNAADVLIQIIREIKEHDAKHPDHGVGCSCHDQHSGKLRQLFEAEGLYDIKESGFRASTKSLSNLMVVFHYLTR